MAVPVNENNIFFITFEEVFRSVKI